MDQSPIESRNFFTIPESRSPVIPKVLKNYYNQTRWKTRDEIIFLLINFLIVSSLIYFYKESLGNDVTYPRSYAEVVLISLSIGIFPIAILVYSVEIRMNLKNQKAAEKINKKRLEYQQLNFGVLNQRRDIVINAETQKNNIFIMQEGDFIFAQGMGNYSSIYFKNNGTISRETIRITLKNLFEQLSEDHPTILRCHRSFIINKSKIRHIRGNARSLVILLEGIEQEIPVSRSFDRKLLT